MKIKTVGLGKEVFTENGDLAVSHKFINEVLESSCDILGAILVVAALQGDKESISFEDFKEHCKESEEEALKILGVLKEKGFIEIE